LAYSCQRPGETQDHYIGSQGPQRTVMLDKRQIIPPMLCTDYFIYLPAITTLGTNSVSKQAILWIIKMVMKMFSAITIML
jgi:hypothetical protein